MSGQDTVESSTVLGYRRVRVQWVGRGSAISVAWSEGAGYKGRALNLQVELLRLAMGA